MLFDTLPFFAFLFLFLIAYHGLRTPGQNLAIVVASYVFYGWWDWRFCFLLAASTLVHYVAGLRLADAHRKLWLIGAGGGQIALLAYFKYCGFFVENLNALLESVGIRNQLGTVQVLLPVGISFYTFQVLSYTIDVWRGKLEPERNFVNFAAFVCFWPHLVAGPILRASNMLPQLSSPRRVDRHAVAEGLYYVMVGLTKKVAIADILSPSISSVAVSPGDFAGNQLWLTAFLFSIRIYCDFSGYTDIARGVSLFMGFRLPDNFRWPYLAVGVREFWHRWHMSLSTWLRDYLYIPLGGSRHGTARTCRNIMITMTLGGLWHGASWSFVLWGILHGIYLVMAQAMIVPWAALRVMAAKWKLRFLVTTVGVAATFVLVTLTWIPFFVPDIGMVWQYLGGLTSGTYAPDPDRVRLLIYATIALLYLDLPEWRADRHYWLGGHLRSYAPVHYGICAVLLITLWTSTYEPFIYFQF